MIGDVGLGLDDVILIRAAKSNTHFIQHLLLASLALDHVWTSETRMQDHRIGIPSQPSLGILESQLDRLPWRRTEQDALIEETRDDHVLDRLALLHEHPRARREWLATGHLHHRVKSLPRTSHLISRKLRGMKRGVPRTTMGIGIATGPPSVILGRLNSTHHHRLGDANQLKSGKQFLSREARHDQIVAGASDGIGITPSRE
jgi:hypothetical protein